MDEFTAVLYIANLLFNSVHGTF
uniref:Uncharacterized protein n=1 Tax=Anguilla anguilla TaxID=7936 RepID=A0A0E9SIR4_ANGAN